MQQLFRSRDTNYTIRELPNDRMFHSVPPLVIRGPADVPLRPPDIVRSSLPKARVQTFNDPCCHPSTTSCHHVRQNLY